MFSLFRRKQAQPQPLTSIPVMSITSKGMTAPQTASTLLATPRRKVLLEHIWQRTALSRSQFATLYQAPLERYAELVQHIPASESHHHAYPGGMLDHGLEIVAYALKLRQSHLLPAGTSPESQAEQAEAWTAGTAYAALLHDLGKIAVDLHIEYADGTLWHPWHGPLTRPYRFRYHTERIYRLHSAATALLYRQVLDESILDWLNGFPELWASLLYILAGQYEHAGTLGEIVIQADQASVAQALGGDPTKALAAPKHALQRHLLEGLRYLLREELKLNQAQASDGWLTQDALWLVSKTVCDKLRAYLLSHGIEGIPASNTTLFGILQDHGMVLPNHDNKAIWKATVTAENGWCNTFTFLKLSPALIWESGERPEAFTGMVQADESTAVTYPVAHDRVSTPSLLQETITPSDPVDSLLEMLDIQTTSLPLASPADMDSANAGQKETPPPTLLTLVPSVESSFSGEHFMVWLKEGIQTRKIMINEAKALIHTVSDTVYLVSPGIFQRYAQEHPALSRLAKQDKVQEWQWVQKQFEALKLHQRQENGLNIWTCEVTGPRKSKRLHGYLLADPSILFEKTPFNNPYLSNI